MNQSEAKSRFEELDVARAMGDISAEELAEFNGLTNEFGFDPDPTWSTFLSSVESALAEEAAPFTSTFADKIVDSVEQLNGNSNSESIKPTEQKTEDTSEPKNIISFITHPACGWIAACVALIFALTNLKEEKSNDGTKPDPPVVTLSEKRSNLLEQDLTLKVDFASHADPEINMGDVVWNSEKQEGYMKLSNIKANDPSKTQYQLWIVDPARDSKPVDGGVFDLGEGDEIIVPIKATLPIGTPVAFVITEEQPGGVVVSSQGEKVIAIAQPKES